MEQTSSPIAPSAFSSCGTLPRQLESGPARYIDRFSDVRILCVGDLMLDVFEYGSVARVSPEAPVPVLKKTGERRMPGGAGNVAINLSALECGIQFAGVIGKDADGRMLVDFMKASGVGSDYIAEMEGYATSVKTRFVAGAHHLLRFDQEMPLCISQDFADQWLGQLEDALKNADLVMLSDYGKGVFDECTAQCLIECAHRYGKPVIVDPKLPDWTIYRGATLVKPNLKEFQAVTGKVFHPGTENFVNEAVAAGREIGKRYNIRHILVTLSEYGMLHIPVPENESPTCLPTEAREVFDVSGAGDTSLAVLGASLAAGASIPEAMKIANAASGIVVGKFGTASVTRDELKKAIHRENSAGIITADQAVAMVREWKVQGRVVGFTNGCFDILHVGHAESFRRAHELCDILIVGLNSDASVRRLKGPTRPVNSENARATMLTSLKAVDYVVLFDSDTALPLVEKIQPDVIAKEGYTLDAWPEGRYVESYGGRAVTLPRVEGISTTSLLEKLK